eukprot:513079-Prymnesium_polylepis.1
MRKWGPPQASCTDSPPTGRRSPVTWTMKRASHKLAGRPSERGNSSKRSRTDVSHQSMLTADADWGTRARFGFSLH